MIMEVMTGEEVSRAAVKRIVELTVVLSAAGMTVAEATEGGMDAEAVDRGKVACRASTLPLSSTLVSDSEGEAEDGARDGEVVGEGVGKVTA